MTAPLPGVYADEQAFLDSVEGEIYLFRSLMRSRPLGKHRYFHILAVRNAILRDTGRSVHIESIWEKLKRCYNMDALEANEFETESYQLPKPDASIIAGPSTSSTTSAHVRFPSPSENLNRHPFFVDEFSLPYEDFEFLLAQRRLRETASLPSSPAPTPGIAEVSAKPTNTGIGTSASRPLSASLIVSTATATTTTTTTTPPAAETTATRTGKRKLGKSKLNLAGLVGGDSDSSALTQESGDEGGEDGSRVAGTPKESNNTGTGTGTDADGRTEDGDEEDVEMREASSVRESPKPSKGRVTKGADRSRRGKAAARGTHARGKKKAKR